MINWDQIWRFTGICRQQKVLLDQKPRSCDHLDEIVFFLQLPFQTLPVFQKYNSFWRKRDILDSIEFLRITIL
ncbi:unnamed protein product [Tenebrio molitor]|nr:unnamed protein product [Tenebrio molitor]